MLRSGLPTVALLSTACGIAPSGDFTVQLGSAGNGVRRELVLPTERCGDYFVAIATIDGHGPFNLMLDTGFPVTQLSDEVARALGVRRSVHAIEIGPQSIRGRIPVNVRDLSGIGMALGMPIDGILGYTTFGHLVITYDFPGSRVVVREGTLEDGADVIALSSSERPFIEGLLDSTTVQLVLDTGFSGGVSLRDFFDQAFEAPPRQVGASVRADGVVTRWGGRLRDDLVFAAFTLRSPIVADAAARNLLGQRVLRNFVVTLDRKSRRVRFATPDSTRPVISSPSLRGSGLVLAPRGDHFEVIDVIADSPAAASPIVAGDRVVALAGQPAAERGCVTDDDDDIARVLTIERGDERFDVTIRYAVLVR
jgi:hypothetical protein